MLKPNQNDILQAGDVVRWRRWPNAPAGTVTETGLRGVHAVATVAFPDHEPTFVFSEFVLERRPS